MKPTAADIVIAIGIVIAISKIEAGDWLDPSEEPISWSCVLYDPEGKRVGGGDAHTAREAMGLARVHGTCSRCLDHQPRCARRSAL
jgi:hypothetical protein